MKLEILTNNYRTTRTTPKVYTTGQLRRAKMRAAGMDNKKILSPSLRSLLEASLILQTTNTEVLASYLKRSPSTIRTEYQQLLTLLGCNKNDKPKK
jgi:hypothetical protein